MVTAAVKLTGGLAVELVVVLVWFEAFAIGSLNRGVFSATVWSFLPKLCTAD
jgi:hypothetical protein